MTDDFDIALTSIRAVVIFLGLVGNIISFVVFSRPVFAKNSISTYSRALAIFESYTIGQFISDMVLLTQNFFFLANSSVLWCKLSFYINSGFGSIPGWILIAFSIDKILVMKRRANFMKKRSIQYLIVLGLALYNLLLYIFVPIYLTPVTLKLNSFTSTICDTSLFPLATFFNVLNLVNASFLPFFIMIVTSSISIKLIRDSKRAVERAGALSMNRRTSRDVKYAITTITLNLLFVAMRLPLIIIGSIGYTKVSSYVTKNALLLFFANSSMSIVVHLVSNSLFRRELATILRFGRQIEPGESKTMMTANSLRPSENHSRHA